MFPNLLKGDSPESSQHVIAKGFASHLEAGIAASRVRGFGWALQSAARPGASWWDPWALSLAPGLEATPKRFRPMVRPRS